MRYVASCNKETYINNIGFDIDTCNNQLNMATDEHNICNKYLDTDLETGKAKLSYVRYHDCW